MSHIPNSAMPHAKAPPEEQEGSAVSKVVDKVRNAPRGALAAGAAVAAGALAAAAIPLVKGALADRKKGEDKAKSSSRARKGA